MKNYNDLKGEKYGQLLVLEKLDKREDGYYVWRCQCDCGGTIEVNTKRLKRGTVTSCGCILKSNTRKGHIAEDITGQRFGRLTAIKRVENKRGRTAWECQCDCGKIHIATTKDLKDGHCKSCGCLHHEKYRSMVDLSEKKYGRLLVEYPTEKRDKKGSIYWHCMCECGNEVEISEDSLVHGGYLSCGCYRKEHVWKNIPNQLHLIDGTCLEILENRKNRSDNKSGFRGVYQLKNGRFRVGIGFKGKKYHIGTTETLEEAICQRIEIEELVHDGFVKAYHIWEKENGKVPDNEKIPFIYDVDKIDGEFQVHTNIEDFQQKVKL